MRRGGLVGAEHRLGHLACGGWLCRRGRAAGHAQERERGEGHHADGLAHFPCHSLHLAAPPGQRGLEPQDLVDGPGEGGLRDALNHHVPILRPPARAYGGAVGGGGRSTQAPKDLVRAERDPRRLTADVHEEVLDLLTPEELGVLSALVLLPDGEELPRRLILRCVPVRHCLLPGQRDPDVRDLGLRHGSPGHRAPARMTT
mmetsp:Transcript_74247/g.234503  ORF Transcript_74247/g.234503 Transcript_74247/m.234503 type:complete len:201 (+) Transcript_74247:1488-2090(+)